MLEFPCFSDWRECYRAVWLTLSPDIPANNMFLGILEQQVAASISDCGNKIAAVYQDGILMGAVLETRDRFPLLSKMDAAVANFAVEHWIELFGVPKGMFGPRASTLAAVDYLKRTKAMVSKNVMQQMAYELLCMTPRTTKASGKMRIAERSNFKCLLEWRNFRNLFWMVVGRVICFLPMRIIQHQTRYTEISAVVMWPVI